MNDPIRDRGTANDDSPAQAFDLDFDAIDDGADDFLDRQVFEIRESLSDFRNL